MIRKILSLFLFMFFLLSCSEDIVKSEKNNIELIYSKNRIHPMYKIFGFTKDKHTDHGNTPIWYPIGDRIIFVYEWYYLASITPDGNNLNIILDNCCSATSVSSDGYILFNKYDDQYIFYIKPGESPVKTNIVGWHPSLYGNINGKYNIAYNYNDPQLGWGIYISDINNSPPIRISDCIEDTIKDWSNDGTKLIFSSGNCIYIYDLINKEKSTLFTNNTEVFCPRFNPDNSLISFACVGPDDGRHAVIWLLRLDTYDAWPITYYPYIYDLETPGTLFLYWSPDGRWIVYDLHVEGELWKVRVFE
ncbi:MAG: TolB family protein [bacterium]